MNEYFNHENKIARQTHGRSSVVNSIFSAIASGFDKIPAPAILTRYMANFGQDIGDVNSYRVDLSPPLTSYEEGQQIRLKIANTNTGAATLDVNGLGPRAIRRWDGTDVEAGDLNRGDIPEFIYDGSFMRMNSPSRSHMAGIAASLAGNLRFTGRTEFELITGPAVQASALDATPEKILKVGSFGLGQRFLENENLNTERENSFVYAFSDAANRFRDSNGYVINHRFSQDYAGQVVIPSTGQASLAIRRQVDGIWEDWKRVQFADVAPGDVDSVVMARNETASTLRRNDPVAGGQLREASASGSVGDLLTGSWVCCGRAAAGEVTIFRRRG